MNKELNALGEILPSKRELLALSDAEFGKMMDGRSLSELLALGDGQFNELMDRYRRMGDGFSDGINTDELMASVLNRDLDVPDDGIMQGRQAYNLMLNIADKLVENPALSMAPGSHVSKMLERIPPAARDYFDPIRAPKWVDGSKFADVSDLWDMNLVGMLLVLYSSSLPSCYLIKRGIPALYDTNKLSDTKYIGQRLYETALMLDEVMGEGGIEVITDVKGDWGDLSEKALDKLVPGGWSKEQGAIQINEPPPKLKVDEFGKRFAEKFEELRKKEKEDSHSYLWGRGFISARKVRALHSSMRYMLTNPGCLEMPDGGCPAGFSSRRTEHAGGCPVGFQDVKRSGKNWNWAEGAPINQEDQAFTLLTFSYLLPRGIEHWGCRLTDEQRHSFLHVWRIVAYAMGMRPELTSDSWEESEELYRRLLVRQGGSSQQGKVLTDTVLEFAGGFLPKIFGMNKSFPVQMMMDQTRLDREIFKDIKDEDSDDPPVVLIGEKAVQENSGFFARVFFFLFRFGFRIYCGMRDQILVRIPGVKNLTTALISGSGRTLFESFRGEYLRKPFYIPVSSTSWVLQPGATLAFQEKVSRWRQILFNMIGAGLVLLAGFTLLSLFFFFRLFERQAHLLFANPGKDDERLDMLEGQMLLSGSCALGSFLLSCFLLLWVVPRYFKSRPHIEENLVDLAANALHPKKCRLFGKRSKK